MKWLRAQHKIQLQETADTGGEHAKDTSTHALSLSNTVPVHTSISSNQAKRQTSIKRNQVLSECRE